MLGYFIKSLDQTNYSKYGMTIMNSQLTISGNAFVSGMKEDVSVSVQVIQQETHSILAQDVWQSEKFPDDLFQHWNHRRDGASPNDPVEMGSSFYSNPIVRTCLVLSGHG